MTEELLNHYFRALASKTRRDIISLLKDDCLCAGDIGKYFNLTGATISHHLKILSESNLIKRKKVKQTVYYSLNIDVWNILIKWFCEMK
ncbi:MAG TPA: metalloregulator ArsR/SmtB family transcription factor [Candidatus Anaerostipes avistercoris]|jgi:ArsR family transcriptional regulator|uniref:Metalloregulator ArsR/SmtB family transcription factor n=1 Tax=Candidatus Anaerostipes avistercoris TaxID=2838462 RepID=A0A9D2PH20_9FIRM|nr:metalloregulator ArsR/SmtB family transcription factor [Candidatus Anaerostipes avistercoris]